MAEPTADPSVMDVRVEAEEGRVAVVGRVGMGRTEPWDDAGIGTRGPERVFPGVPIGFGFDTVRFSVGEEAVRLLCDSAGRSFALVQGRVALGRAGGARR